MVHLPLFNLPLQSGAPPDGYGWEQDDWSDAPSRATAFRTGINNRDIFLSRNRCVVCGVSTVVEHCHICPQAELQTWDDLRVQQHWIPLEAKEHPMNEPHNGMLMCPTHHKMFDQYWFFIRFLPEIGKYVFINFAECEDLSQYHGKAIGLDVRDHHAPFPSLFIIHEMRVCGFHPFHPISPLVPDQITWQDWILTGGVFNPALGSFNRICPPPILSTQPQPQVQQPGTSSGPSGPVSGGRRVELNDNVIAEILAATYASPSWKACQIEGTSWSGSAEENIQKYISSIGVQDTSDV